MKKSFITSGPGRLMAFYSVYKVREALSLEPPNKDLLLNLFQTILLFKNLFIAAGYQVRHTNAVFMPPSVNICNHPSIDFTVQVCNSETL